jgi:endonuclease/exonuclease/phosphatase family metal-dependent hydrolase
MTRSKVRHIAALAAAGIALSGAMGVAATTTAAPAQAAPATLRVITHNLEKNGEALTRVVAKANETSGAEVLLLQEVCNNMLDRIANQGPMQWHPRRNNDKCAGGVIGEAVVYTGGGAVTRDVVELNTEPTDANHKYGMACLIFTHAGRATRACSTHLAAGKEADRDALRAETTSLIRGKAANWIANKDVVIIGGDFNSEPGSATMNAMYGVGSGAAGNFRELHQMATGQTFRGGPDTFWARKIDYIFASMKGTATEGGSQHVEGTPSDHEMLYGRVPLS